MRFKVTGIVTAPPALAKLTVPLKRPATGAGAPAGLAQTEKVLVLELVTVPIRREEAAPNTGRGLLLAPVKARNGLAVLTVTPVTVSPVAPTVTFWQVVAFRPTAPEKFRVVNGVGTNNVSARLGAGVTVRLIGTASVTPFVAVKVAVELGKSVESTVSS
jgi:hypothetical protein